MSLVSRNIGSLEQTSDRDGTIEGPIEARREENKSMDHVTVAKMLVFE